MKIYNISMNKKEVKNRIEVLKKEINRHRYLYHVLDKPEISDEAHDSLKHELQELERKYPEFVTPDSPTQRVGGEPLDKFVKVKHETPMMSMEDIFTFEELADWEKRITRILGHKPDEYFVEPKMDGLAISLVYEKGILVRAATRGDGRIGEDVTQNIKTIEAIPLRLEFERIKSEINSKFKILNSKLIDIIKKEKFEVRGEVYISKEEFLRLNEQQEKKGLPKYANPRNIAAGSIRQLDPKIAAERKLDFNIYEVDTDIGNHLHSDNFKIAKMLGFKINPYIKLLKNIKEIKQYFKKMENIRPKLPYQVDGIVVKVNDLLERKKLGIIGKAYRWEIAYKWQPEQVTTVVNDIVVQVGRTGALTPVAVLKPVLLAGSVVSRATLHNEDDIRRKDVRIGDTVIIQKAGDVIPEVVEVLKGMRQKNAKIFHMPKKCPVCKSSVIRIKGEAIHRCTNPECFEVIRRRIIHFASKGAFNIEGLGPKIIDALISNNLIKSAVDLFDLVPGDLEPLERFAEKSSKNIYNAIQNAKKISLERFIYSLSIRLVGKELSEDLAKQFGNLEKFRKASFEEINRMYGVAQKTAREITNWLSKKGHQNFIDDLLKMDIEVKPYHSPVLVNKLVGKSFVVTGTLPTLTREDMHKKIIQHGGKVLSSVTSKTDYLIAGENPGSKYNKAKKLKINIISEQEFIKMIK